VLRADRVKVRPEPAGIPPIVPRHWLFDRLRDATIGASMPAPVTSRNAGDVSGSECHQHHIDAIALVGPDFCALLQAPKANSSKAALHTHVTRLTHTTDWSGSHVFPPG